MPAQNISAETCVRLVETATTACQPMASAQPIQPQPNWDAMANSFASLSASLSWGALLLAIIFGLATFGWGYVVKVWAEREAREEAQRCAEKWLEDEATPLLRREMEEFRKTFPPESPKSANEVDQLVAAMGADRKEDDNGK